MKRIATAVFAAAAATAVVAVPGVAAADTNPQSTAAHLCYLHRELPQCSEPQDHNLDYDWRVFRQGGEFTFWDHVRMLEEAVLDTF